MPLPFRNAKTGGPKRKVGDPSDPGLTLRMLRPQVDGLAEETESLFHAALLRQGHTEHTVCVGVVGLQLQDLAKARNGFIAPALGGQDVAQTVVQLGRGGLEAQGTPKTLLRFCELSLRMAIRP
jgi:hypothetical protein